MKIETALFFKSASTISQCPDVQLPEYAFIGRSNVGKSSLINYITGLKGLAKISGTPGKTQLINYFIINNSWHLVDLPGIGYAKVSKKSREKFAHNTSSYLVNREQLLCIFMLLDIRHSPQKIDMEFMSWMATKGLPFVMVFTKADKLNKAEIARNLNTYKSEMLEEWEELPPIFVTSSTDRTGKEEILSFIEETNKLMS